MPRLRALLVCFAALLAAPAAEAANPYPRKGDVDPHLGVAQAKRKAVQGIDVARYQGEVDWREVRKAGTRFAFIKATEGGDLLDPMFRRNWREAKEAGVPRGAYHFVFWCRPARDQIRWFIRNVPKEPDALPPVLDVEWSHKTSCRRPTAAKARAKMREMLAAFEAHYGKRPIIYTDISFHEDVLEGVSEFDRYPFWVRSVAAHPRERYGSRRWEFWQFTATGRVPGVKGDVDRNAFFGTERQFRDWLEGRYDIAARRMVQPPAGVASAEPRAERAPARRDEPPAQPAPRPLALSAEPPRAAPPPALREAPPRPRPGRRERPVPPGLVPDVTGSVAP